MNRGWRGFHPTRNASTEWHRRRQWHTGGGRLRRLESSNNSSRIESSRDGSFEDIPHKSQTNRAENENMGIKPTPGMENEVPRCRSTKTPVDLHRLRFTGRDTVKRLHQASYQPVLGFLVRRNHLWALGISPGTIPASQTTCQGALHTTPRGKCRRSECCSRPESSAAT